MVVGQLLFATAQLVHAVLQLAWFLLLARIVLSWVNPSPPPGLVRSVIGGIYRLTDPVLDRARQALPFLVVGGLDLTPIAVFFAIRFTDTFLTGSLMQLASSM